VVTKLYIYSVWLFVQKVIQRRDSRGGGRFVNGSWSEYENGFGSAYYNGQYYLGMMNAQNFRPIMLQVLTLPIRRKIGATQKVSVDAKSTFKVLKLDYTAHFVSNC